MNNIEDKKIFPGFPSKPKAPNFWSFPKVLDQWMHTLTAPEQIVLMYLLRHTWGYGKTVDCISIDQFLHGIQRRDGTVLDTGIGLKDRRTVRNALQGLENKGIIIKKFFPGAANEYSLKIDPSQEMSPLTSNDTTPTTLNDTGDYSHQMSDTIDKRSIENNNNFPSKEGSSKKLFKKETEELLNFLTRKLYGRKVTNVNMQTKYIKIMLLADYSVEDITWTIETMLEETWWQENSISMKNVCDHIQRYTSRYKKNGKSTNK